jgi:hypothetical protein
MKSIIAVSWVTDDYRSIVNIENLQKSLYYFNPNIRFEIFDTKDTQDAQKKYPWANNYWMKAISCLKYSYDYDMTIGLDGDIIITGDLEEIVNSTEDVLCVRNMNSQGKAGADYWGNTITLNDKIINSIDYANAGLVASNSKQFWEDWLRLNMILSATRYNGLADEQGSLNYIFHSNKYTTKFLDGPSIKKSYGLTNVWGTNGNHWESWKSMYIKNNKIFLDDPVEGEIEIKVLHQAGGGMAASNNMQYGGFRNWLRTVVTDEVNDFIDMITK